MADALPVSVIFTLITSESDSLLHMQERAKLPDGLALINNALGWYKIYRKCQASDAHMIARNPDTGSYYFIHESARAGYKMQKQTLMLMQEGIDTIRANFPDDIDEERDVPSILSDAFLVLDQVITAQLRRLTIKAMNGNTPEYKTLMANLLQPKHP